MSQEEIPGIDQHLHKPVVFLLHRFNAGGPDACFIRQNHPIPSMEIYGYFQEAGPRNRPPSDNKMEVMGARIHVECLRSIIHHGCEQNDMGEQKGNYRYDCTTVPGLNRHGSLPPWMLVDDRGIVVPT